MDFGLIKHRQKVVILDFRKNQTVKTQSLYIYIIILDEIIYIDLNN